MADQLSLCASLARFQYLLHADVSRNNADCDERLLPTFKAECDLETNFFVKASAGASVFSEKTCSSRATVQTHYPAVPRILPPHDQDHYKQYTQAVHLSGLSCLRTCPSCTDARPWAVRNPLDSVASWWNLMASGDHSQKIETVKFTPRDRPILLDQAKRWRNHALYWDQAPLRTHTIRYEDLRSDPIPVVSSFDTPNMARILIVVVTDARARTVSSPSPGSAAPLSPRLLGGERQQQE